MSQPYELSDIYAGMQNMVKLWPIEDNKPQTFCVITSMTAMSADNLGRDIRDKNRSYFYSKAWADVMYSSSNIKWSPPAVFVFETTGTLSSDASGQTVHTVEVLIVDSHIYGDKTKPKLSNQEPNKNQIFEYTERILRKVVQYISKQLPLPNGWSIPFRAAFQQENESISFSRWESDTLNLVGNLATINLPVPCGTEAITLRTSKQEHTTADHHTGEEPITEPARLASLDLDVLTTLAGHDMAPND